MEEVDKQLEEEENAEEGRMTLLGAQSGSTLNMTRRKRDENAYF